MLGRSHGKRRLAFGVIVLALGVAGIWIAPASTRATADGHLEAIVGTNDGFDIALNDASGDKVARLAPGTYTIVVHDHSALHNFHMASNTDPNVDFRTGLDFVGDETFTVTFKPGLRYAYACEPHFQVMNGEFRIDELPSTTSTTATPPPPKAVTLAARVNAAGKASLAPTNVKRGAVRIVVRDDSHRYNFHLAGAGVNRKTTAKFVGKTTWTVRLGTGVYRFGADPRRLSGTLHVR
jgi:plastocyanin